MQVRKRKAITHEAADPQETPIYDELGNGPLNGILSQDQDPGEDSEDDSSNGMVGDENDFGHIWSDEEDEREVNKDGILEGPANVIRNSNTTNGTTNALKAVDEPLSRSEDVREEDEASFGRQEQNYTLTTDANGKPRYVYNEISPVYDSDDSDAPLTANTIGNIPLSFYDSYPHIGYDINGKKIARPAKDAALDSLLDSIEIPKGWTGLTDPATGKPLELNEEQLDTLKRLTRNEAAGNGYDPYPEMVAYFTSKTESMPLSAAPEPKRRFVPSKHEAKRVMKMAKAIKEGRIQPYRPPPTEDELDEQRALLPYDLWAQETPRPEHPMHMPAPKLPPPSYDESYHPPPEYLPDEKELQEWRNADEEDRPREFLPADHDALRKVPGYARFVKDKFERCLDLYLAPRILRSKLDMDPESLLPKLDSADDHRPFPQTCMQVFRGHKGRVRSLAIHPSKGYVASGGDDGTVRLWHLSNASQTWLVKLSDTEPVCAVRWRSGGEESILSVAVGDSVYLIAPHFDPEVNSPDTSSLDTEPPTPSAKQLLLAGFSAPKDAKNPAPTNKSPTKWQRPPPSLQAKDVHLHLTFPHPVHSLTWHRRGAHFSTVSPSAHRASITIHTLATHTSQLPFRRFKGYAQCVRFHPSKPLFFVASQRTIQVFDLARQALVKTLQPGARWISSFEVHPGGDNVLVGTYDRRTLWLDLDLSPRPYKTLRFHARGVRAVRFHPRQERFALFADASDDGSVQVFHARVGADLMENVAITPLTVLRGHEVVQGLGVMDVDWHPTDPVCVSAGADGTCRVWS